MMIVGVCFILYLMKLSAGKGYLHKSRQFPDATGKFGSMILENPLQNSNLTIMLEKG